MSTLQEKCVENIAKQLMKAPPVLQEMICQNTVDKMTEIIENDVYKLLTNNLPFLVNIIINDMIETKITDDNIYYSLYGYYDRPLLDLAIKIAKRSYETIEEHRFPLPITSDSIFYWNSSDDEDDNMSI